MFGRKKVNSNQKKVLSPEGGAETIAALEKGENSSAIPTEEARKQLAAGAKLVSAAFGEIVTLLMRAPGYKHYTLSDLEWLAIPPLLSNQFTLAEARSKETGLSAPVGIALWASVSDEVDKRLSETLDAPLKLRPDEWRSGDQLWLVDVVGPPKIVQALIQRLRTEDFKDKTFKLRIRGTDGNAVVREIAPNTTSLDPSK